MDYSAILFKFRSCMEEIGDALREVLGTNDKYKFTEIATSIKTCNQVYYLGTGTSFDVSGIPGYQNLTKDNFIVGASAMSVSGGGGVAYRDDLSMSVAGGGSISKSYDASKGVLTISGVSGSAAVAYSASGHFSLSNYFAYLIKGKIKNA